MTFDIFLIVKTVLTLYTVIMPRKATRIYSFDHAQGRITFAGITKPLVEKYMSLILGFSNLTKTSDASKTSEIITTLGKTVNGDDVTIFIIETDLSTGTSQIKEQVTVRKYNAHNELRKFLSKYNIFFP